MKVFIGGDMSITPLVAPTLVAGDLETVFGDVEQLVKGADVFIANLECSLTDKDTPIRKFGPNHKAPTACARALKKLGVTDMGLANNHLYDFGHGGYVDTLAALDQAGIRYTGVGENAEAARRIHFIEAEDMTIALIAVCEHEYTYALHDREGCNGFDPILTLEDIAAAKAKSNFVIVLHHCGNEQCEFPSPRLRGVCQGMVRAGADLVLCQHSHCIGAEEMYQGGKIVYGQGNFFFVRPGFKPQWENGLLLELDLCKGKKPEYIWHPVELNAHGINLCQGEEKEKVLKAFAERSNLLGDRVAWLAQWHAFCESVEQRYHDAIALAFSDESVTIGEMFAHYLDSEAHSDVWRELYPTWNGNNTIEVNQHA